MNLRNFSAIRQRFQALIRWLFVLFVSLLLVPSSFAPVIRSIAAIDNALNVNQNIVAATLENVGSKTIFRIDQILYPPNEQFSSYVSGHENRIVLAGMDWFVWPRSLASFDPGQFVIAFLRERPGELPQGWDSAPYELLTMVPTSKRSFPSRQSLSDIRDLIRSDLLNQINNENSPDRQLALLRFVFPILREEDAGIIRSFLQHSESQHHRTANALLLALTWNPKYIPAVEKDLEPILEHVPHGEDLDMMDL